MYELGVLSQIPSHTPEINFRGALFLNTQFDSIFAQPPTVGRGQWSKGRIPLHTTLIPAAANREAGRTVVGVAVDGAVVEAQAAGPGKGPGRDGGGPPKAVVGQVAENSIVAPKAARQGSEAG